MADRKIKDGLFKNPGGKVWQYQFRFRGVMHQGSTGHTARPSAVEWLRAFKVKLANAEVGIEGPREVPTLREALDKWASMWAGGEKHKNQMLTLAVHCEDELRMTIDKLTNDEVKVIRARYLTTTGVGGNGAKHTHTAGGANGVIKLLSSLIGTFVRKEGQESAPLAAMPFKLAKLPVQKKSKGIVWPEKVQAFLAAVDAKSDKHVQLAVRMAIGLGLREDEILTAQWHQIDQRRRVFIADKTKNREVREIPIPAWLMSYILSWDTNRKGLIMPSLSNKGVVQPHAKNYLSDPVTRAAGIVKIANLTPHRLRATFATVHFESGTPISQIQQMMGHADPETTMIYIVQRPKDQAVAQETVALLMGFPAPAIEAATA